MSSKLSAFSTYLPVHSSSSLSYNGSNKTKLTEKLNKKKLTGSTNTRATLAQPMPVTPIKTSTKPKKSSSIRELSNENELKLNLKRNKDNQVLVVKCHASYCAGCRGVAPKYKKIAQAYNDSNAPVSFYEMDYAKNEAFCKDRLGAINLPFFAVFKGNQLISAQSIGWRSINNTLVNTIDHAINDQDSI